MASAHRRPLAYDTPLLMLPFDHRSSFSKELLGLPAHLTSLDARRVSEYKDIVYRGFLATATDPRSWYAILADDEFAGQILHDAKRRGYCVAMPVERSGQQVFSFDTPRWRERILQHKPTIVKVLVRYNPQGDANRNREQLARLHVLSTFCVKQRIPLLFELLVPPTAAQSAQHAPVHFDSIIRPRLVVEAIKQIQRRVHVSIWKLEGLSKEQWRAVIAATRAAPGDTQPVFIVLGRNAQPAVVERWLRAAAPFPEVVGFAVGRTIFFPPLERYRDGKCSRAEAVANIGKSFHHFTSVWHAAKHRAGLL